MNPEQREQLRLSLLRFLDSNPTRFGLPSRYLVQMARSEGFSETDKTQIENELSYLEDKALVAEAMKGVSPENRHWRITASGRDFWAQRNDH
jgi:hypothetical protein